MSDTGVFVPTQAGAAGIPATPGAWATTTQRVSTLSDGNTYVPSVIVGFNTGLGNYGYVEVAASDYPAKVPALISAAAAAMDGVSQMTSENTGGQLPGLG